MNKWNVLKRNFPEFAREMVRLGAPLYEAGADFAKERKELEELVELLKRAPQEVRSLLELEQVTRESVLVTVFQLGGALLLVLEGGGTC